MRKGYVIISVTLILLVVTTGIILTLSFLSLGSLNIAESRNGSDQIFYYSDACLEEAVLRLKRDAFYAGGSVEFPNGTCHIDLQEDNGGYVFKVYFSGRENYSRAIEAKAEMVNGSISIIDWSEKLSVVE
jgi:hypothetical protein